MDHNGILYVSSGSSQWTHLQSYSTSTGKLLSSASGIREQSLIRLNSAATKIYALTTLENPGLRTYLNDQGLLKEGEHSPMQMSTYQRGTNLELKLNGRYALTNTGEMFSVNGKTDGFEFTSFAESQQRNEIYFAKNKKLIRVNSAADKKNKYHIAAYGEVEFIFTDSTRNELVMLSTVKTGKDRKTVLAVEKIAFQS